MKRFGRVPLLLFVALTLLITPLTAGAKTVAPNASEQREEVTQAVETAKVQTAVIEPAAVSVEVVTQESSVATDKPTEADGAAPSATAEEVEPEAPNAGNLVIHYLDVGQGDSEFIEFPDGTTMLVDAGPTSAGSTVVDYIKARGYTKIDHLVATHPHEDHIGGMVAVMSAFEIGEIWAPHASNDTATFEAFLDKAASQGIRTACAGKTIYEQGDIRAHIVSPNSQATVSDVNDSSAIIVLTYGEKVFAFTGDAGVSVQNAALSGHVDILKVGHHGSEDAISAALVTKLSPSFAVISVGRNNYGLPDPEALSQLAMVSVFRTDLQGTIVATSDGSSLSFNVDIPQTADAAAASAVAAGIAQETGAGPDSDKTVYITNTGKKYHNDGCSFLKKSKIPIRLGDAQAEGYTACSKCAE